MASVVRAWSALWTQPEMYVTNALIQIQAFLYIFMLFYYISHKLQLHSDHIDKTINAFTIINICPWSRKCKSEKINE